MKHSNPFAGLHLLGAELSAENYSLCLGSFRALQQDLSVESDVCFVLRQVFQKDMSEFGLDVRVNLVRNSKLKFRNAFRKGEVFQIQNIKLATGEAKLSFSVLGDSLSYKFLNNRTIKGNLVAQLF